MAYTADLEHAEAHDGHHKIRLCAKGLNSTINFPDLPEDDFSRNKGDLWKLDLEADFGFTGCITVDDIERISILHGSNDGWNIESIVTFAVVDKRSWELISSDFNIFQWIDGDFGEDRKEFTLSLRLSSAQCIRYLYIMAHTSDLKYSETNGTHKVELKTKQVTKAIPLPDLPGNEQSTSKGDLWKLNIECDFGFSGCITKDDIEGIAFVEASSDGWHIDSVVTYVTADEYNWKLSSVDLDANKWVDGDSAQSIKRFDLNLVL